MHKLTGMLSVVTLALAIGPLSAPVSAQANDQRAKDGLELFYSFCVRPTGDKSQALTVLGTGNSIANRLSDEATRSLYGQEGGVAWAIRSPSNAELLIGFNPAGICEVRIAEADEASVNFQYSLFTNLIGLKSKGHRSKPQKRSENGAELTYQTYMYELDNRKALIALTTSDRRVGDQQHLITFGFVS